MQQLFPPEIIENTVQSHWAKRHSTSKIIYTSITISLIAVLVSLPLIHIDVSNQSRGTIRTPNENNNLQMPIYGQVEKTNLFENKAVNAGDTLLWLRTDELDEREHRLHTKIQNNDLFLTDIHYFLMENSGQIYTPKYKTEYAQYKAKIAEQDIVLKQNEREYLVSKQLYEKGVEANFEYEQVASRYQSSISQAQLIKQQEINTWQAEETRLKYENEDFVSELIQIEKHKKQYIIIAPVTGNIVQYIGTQAGNFLSAGQTIAQITAKDSLLIECYVSPNDIAYIHVGQEVNFQIDSFNYQQWGLMKGRVIEIISDIIVVNEHSFFRVRCVTNKNYLELPNGYRGQLQKGMATTARFFLARRSLAQLIFDIIDNWMNPKIINHGDKG